MEDQIPIYPNDLNTVPDGAVIVGFVHNHTALGQNSSQDQRRMSLDDLAILPQLRSYVNANGLGRGVSVDANMLMYIHAPEAVGPQDANRTRVHDKFDDENDFECALQGPSA